MDVCLVDHTDVIMSTDKTICFDIRNFINVKGFKLKKKIKMFESEYVSVCASNICATRMGRFGELVRCVKYFDGEFKMSF